jgi:two-component system cell cycle response regulator DivK
MFNDPPPESLRGARVLVTDDEDLVRTVYAEVLRRYGAEVAEAADGAEGVSLARALRPDLVLMDLRMPGTDGWEALAALRADPATAGLVVVAFSSDTSQATRGRALEAGFDAFLEKAYTAGNLVRALEGLLREARERREKARPADPMSVAAAALLPFLPPLLG